MIERSIGIGGASTVEPGFDQRPATKRQQAGHVGPGRRSASLGMIDGVPNVGHPPEGLLQHIRRGDRVNHLLDRGIEQPVLGRVG